MLLETDKDRIHDNLNTLSTFSSCPEQEGVTHTLFSEAEIGTCGYVKGLMTQVDLFITEDAIGNISGTLADGCPDLVSVRNGSHTDTVHDDGMYDGMVGMIDAIKVCRVIKENSISHQRSITVLVFTSEEPTRYKFGCIGNRALAGRLSLGETKGLVDENGISLYDEPNRFEYTKMNYSKVTRRKGDIFTNIELYIEQALVLEQLNCPIGIVETICAPTYINMVLEGQQEHAGFTPVSVRHDVMTTVCEVVLKIEGLARSYGSNYMIATVGRMLPFPNSSNVIAGRVEFSIDMRDISEDRKTDMIQKTCSYIDTIIMLRGSRASHCVTTGDLSHSSDRKVMAVTEESCTREGIFPNKMISGTHHDSLFIAEFTSMEVIFVPSHKGISHGPAGYADMDDIVLGTEVLIDTLLTLSNSKEIQLNKVTY